MANLQGLAIEFKKCQFRIIRVGGRMIIKSIDF